MREIILQGLMITIIGMGLVFAVIIFLWWLMGLLVKATTRPEKQAGLDPDTEVGMAGPLVPEMADIEKQRRAAAAAVAVGLALAQCHRGSDFGESPSGTGTMSPWQSVHRARGLERQQKRG